MVSNSPESPFDQSDLGLDLMTLILKLDLDMAKMSHHTKNEVSMSRHSKVTAQTHTHTHTHTHRQTQNNMNNMGLTVKNLI